MICMSRRRRRNSEPFAFTRSTPSKSTTPEVGSMRRRMSRPRVLLPEPDSPTKPSVSPSWISSETSSTARTSPARRPPNGDSARSKVLLRLRTSSKGTGREYQRLESVSASVALSVSQPRPSNLNRNSDDECQQKGGHLRMGGPNPPRQTELPGRKAGRSRNQSRDQ